ncbi:MAG TPA: hypothetical protein VKH35_12465 [Thermoanaerobaculia bacterium]|nr:hypothetical protein [Thermoanaerobaculia bacterium]
MRGIKRLIRSIHNRLQQRGSALLASLMVIVGLSLLGLAFVAISETESAISVNERNHTQTVGIAEAGARLIVQWFQYPDLMLSQGLMPANAINLKTLRPSIGAYGGGYYKATAGTKFCDLPFGPKDEDLFYGAEDGADVKVDNSSTEGQTFLTSLNNQLFGAESGSDARPAGEITEIRIYAPPIVGATALTDTATGFTYYQGGTRYGVATIMVRAQKFDRPASQAGRRAIATADCRIVVSQYPLPNPAGPLQSQNALATNGNFNVHWGLVSSELALNLQKDYTTVPWFNAYDRIYFNLGYDSSKQWAVNTNYIAGDIVRCTPTSPQQPTCAAHSFKVTTGGNSGATEPTWPSINGTPVTQGAVTYLTRATTAWPLTTVGTATNTPWLYFIADGNVTVDDPWFQSRTASNDQSASNNQPQPWPFPFANPASYGPTHHFQFQSFDSYPNYRRLLFPNIDYNFWKAAAMAGNGQDGVKYLRWVSADLYTDGVTTDTFRNWCSSRLGFYFFETQNNTDPQNGGPGVLAPAVQINGGGAYMGSFIYLNAGFSTTGLSGPTGWFTQPGEPYMDIGYRKVDLTSATGDFIRDASGVPEVHGAFNNQWDYQDLPWSNSGAIGGGAQDGKFDVFIASRTVHDPSDTANPNSTYTGWFPVPYTPGCFPGDNTCAGCNCSEPHEPYLNVKYNGNPMGITLGWFDPSTAVTTMRKPIKTGNGLHTGTPVVCTAASSEQDCTSNTYDIVGGLVSLPPATDGVLYVEGDFTSKGNADYYGSVLVGGNVNSQGTPNIWYDESLSRGYRPPGFPRVMVTSVETDR